MLRFQPDHDDHDEACRIVTGVAFAVQSPRMVDREAGEEPGVNEDRSILVALSGPIHNAAELRKELRAAGHRLTSSSDAEVIAHLYEDVGAGCLDRLRGAFSLAVWDVRGRQLLLARDRLGVKPLYYAETPDGLVFASEQKAVLSFPEVQRELNVRSLGHFLSFGFVVGPDTLFRALRQLPPGCRLTYRAGKVSLERYWDFPEPSSSVEDRRRSVSAWTEMLRDKLEASVSLRLHNDTPAGAWLSGGVDSSAVVALMARHRSGPLPVAMLSFSFAGFDEVHGQSTLLDHPDYPLQGRVVVCTPADLSRLPEALWYAEEPTTSGLEVLRLLLVEASARDTRVVLAGEGADEVFGGYLWFLLDKLIERLSPIPPVVRRAVAGFPVFQGRFHRVRSLLSAPSVMDLARYRILLGVHRLTHHQPLTAQMRACVHDAAEPAWELPLPQSFPRWDRFSQLQYYEGHIRLPSFVIGTLDRVAMARSVEMRLPFLDHELVELAARIPPALKLKGLREKYILRQAVQHVLPREIAQRRKRGLGAPVAAWLRAELPEFAHELLSSPALRRSGYFDPGTVARMLSEHRARRQDWGYRLMGVLAVQLWDHMFLQGKGPLP